MKIFNKYIMGALVLGTATLGLQSCDLDEYNPSGEGADAVYTTANGMEYLVNQLYYNFGWKYFGREDPVLYMEGSADIWQNRADAYDYGNHNTRYLGLQGDKCGQSNNAWKRVYDNINVANNILAYLPKNNNISAAQRSDFEGEARAMRAYCYWWLVEMFGDIELRTEPTETAEFTAYRTDRKVIYDQVIIPDAEAATKLLPAAEYQGDKGRLTRKAAYAILARTCLARAQYETEGSAEQKAFYQKALDAANYVMNNQASLGISLYTTYDEIWQAKNNKNNSEYLWVCTHSSNSSLNAQPSNPNRLHVYYTPKLINKCGIAATATSWNYPKETGFSLAPTYYFMKLWKDWDIRYQVFFQEEFCTLSELGYKWTEAMCTSFKLEGDIKEAIMNAPRVPNGTVMKFVGREVTHAEKLAEAEKGIVLLGLGDVYDLNKMTAAGGAPMKSNDDPTTNQDIKTSFPRFNKFRIWDGDENGTILLAAANGQVGFADVPLIRFAEMPLIAAECYIGLGNKPGAVNVIKQYIRNERVKAPGHTIEEVQADVIEANMTIDWILEERARELCGEHLRWFDLKRTKKLVDYVRGHNPSMTGDDCVDEKNYLWPIPNDYLDKLTNAEEFGQNPGYNAYVRSTK
ncbi:MAG: RagB/SusD family nutrient uptake outer membrane protein [Bacteroidales bacterium]|nr:RagB/SusD family nutrient uptake outer membrane protein [Bacteroidales bacterium]